MSQHSTGIFAPYAEHIASINELLGFYSSFGLVHGLGGPVAEAIRPAGVRGLTGVKACLTSGNSGWLVQPRWDLTLAEPKDKNAKQLADRQQRHCHGC